LVTKRGIKMRPTREILKSGKDNSVELAKRVAKFDLPVHNNSASWYFDITSRIAANAAYLTGVGFGLEAIQRANGPGETLYTVGTAGLAGLLMVPGNVGLSKGINWVKDKINARTGRRNVWGTIGQRVGQAAVVAATCISLAYVGNAMVVNNKAENGHVDPPKLGAPGDDDSGDGMVYGPGIPLPADDPPVADHDPDPKPKPKKAKKGKMTADEIVALDHNDAAKALKAYGWDLTGTDLIELARLNYWEAGTDPKAKVKVELANGTTKRVFSDHLLDEGFRLVTWSLINRYNFDNDNEPFNDPNNEAYNCTDSRIWRHEGDGTNLMDYVVKSQWQAMRHHPHQFNEQFMVDGEGNPVLIKKTGTKINEEHMQKAYVAMIKCLTGEYQDVGTVPHVSYRALAEPWGGLLNKPAGLQEDDMCPSDVNLTPGTYWCSRSCEQVLRKGMNVNGHKTGYVETVESRKAFQGNKRVKVERIVH